MIYSNQYSVQVHMSLADIVDVKTSGRGCWTGVGKGFLDIDGDGA